MKSNKLTQIWNNRGAIVEGIANSLFKQEHVEQIAAERMSICNNCPHIDQKGSLCVMPGTQPCCGKCGCSLAFKSRSLSSACGDEENPRWHALLSQEEEDALNEKLNNESE